LGKEILTVDHPQYAVSYGAAMIAKQSYVAPKTEQAEAIELSKVH
jgi:activator of 2-hydroxyglutaryl-CoA dehydratase